MTFIDMTHMTVGVTNDLFGLLDELVKRLPPGEFDEKLNTVSRKISEVEYELVGLIYEATKVTYKTKGKQA